MRTIFSLLSTTKTQVTVFTKIPGDTFDQEAVLLHALVFPFHPPQLLGSYKWHNDCPSGNFESYGNKVTKDITPNIMPCTS